MKKSEQKPGPNLKGGKARGRKRPGIPGGDLLFEIQKTGLLVESFDLDMPTIFVGGAERSRAAAQVVAAWTGGHTDYAVALVLDASQTGRPRPSAWAEALPPGASSAHVASLPSTDAMPALQSTLRALSHEVTERALLFASAGCLNAVAYEKTTGDKVARLLLVIDGFRELSSRLDFENSFRDQATPAGQLWTILRTGRSQGIQVMLCLDSASSQSLSDSLLPFFQNKMVGSVSAAEAARLFDVGAIMPVDRKSGSLAFVDSRLELKQFPDWEPAMVSTWLVSRKRKPGGKILSFEPESLLARANTGDPLGAIKGALSHLISSYRDREQVLTKHMAERMGVEPSTASLILNGKLERFTLDHLIKCATRLGDPHINRLIAEARRVLSVQ